MAGYPQLFTRIWPSRHIEGLNQSRSVASFPGNQDLQFRQMGIAPQAYYLKGTAAANNLFILTAGGDIDGIQGTNLTLTITSGALTVTQVGFDITIQCVTGTTTTAAVVTAVNAFFTGTAAQFVQAVNGPGSTGAGVFAATTVAKTNFTMDQRR